jgi:hypothetical protein
MLGWVCMEELRGYVLWVWKRAQVWVWVRVRVLAGMLQLGLSSCQQCHRG